MKDSGELVAAVFRGISNEMKTKMLAPAVKEVGERIATTMRLYVPVRYGALRESIDNKVVAYPQSGNAVAITGPKRKTKYQTPKGVAAPAKYAHLVEFGFVDRSGKFRAPQRPFMRPAIDAVAPVAPKLMEVKIVSAMERAAKKYWRT